MIQFKKEIAKKIAEATELDISEIEGYIEVPPSSDMGDYAFPCFRLAKILKKSPMLIAEELKEKINIGENIEKIEIVSGYLNFFINKTSLIQTVLKELEEKQDNFGANNSGNGKNIIVEYSSPNIAKPFHIGHLRNTIIGAALYNIYK